MTLTAVINPVVPLNLLFPHQRVICPHSRQSAKYRIVTHNFTNDDLTDGNSPSYHSANIFNDKTDVAHQHKEASDEDGKNYGSSAVMPIPPHVGKSKVATTTPKISILFN